MFLCNRCHSPKCTCLGFSGSRGACEGCGRTSDCVDCHGRSKVRSWVEKKDGTVVYGAEAEAIRAKKRERSRKAREAVRTRWAREKAKGPKIRRSPTQKLKAILDVLYEWPCPICGGEKGTHNDGPCRLGDVIDGRA